MRIGINTLFLLPGKVGGTETYVRGLINSLVKVDSVNEYIIYTNQENHTLFEFTESNFNKVLCNLPARIKSIRILWEQLIFPQIVKKEKLDILHSPGYVSPVRVKTKTVVTIPDMQYQYYPENFSKPRLWYWQHYIPRSAQQAKRIITLSENSKKDIVRLLNVEERKVAITYPASQFAIGIENNPDKKKTFNKYGIKSPYILSVASLLPHKNLARLIDAFSMIMDKTDHNLVLVGLKLQSLAEIQIQMKLGNIKPSRVILPGYISDTELVNIYREASVFVLPSLFEGFGIPVLEAMSCGCPVVAANRTSLPEVVGDAGILVNPENSSEIAEAIYNILTNPNLRNQLIDKGYQRTQLFSWEQMAKETIKVYQTVMDE